MAEANDPNAPVPPPGDRILETPEEARQRAARERELHKDEEAGAAVAATGIGCLSFALLPWSIGLLIILGILIMWLFHGR